MVATVSDIQSDGGADDGLVGTQSTHIPRHQGRGVPENALETDQFQLSHLTEVGRRSVPPNHRVLCSLVRVRGEHTILKRGKRRGGHSNVVGGEVQQAVVRVDRNAGRKVEVSVAIRVSVGIDGRDPVGPQRVAKHHSVGGTQRERTCAGHVVTADRLQRQPIGRVQNQIFRELEAAKAVVIGIAADPQAATVRRDVSVHKDVPVRLGIQRIERRGGGGEGDVTGGVQSECPADGITRRFGDSVDCDVAGRAQGQFTDLNVLQFGAIDIQPVHYRRIPQANASSTGVDDGSQQRSAVQ